MAGNLLYLWINLTNVLAFLNIQFWGISFMHSLAECGRRLNELPDSVESIIQAYTYWPLHDKWYSLDQIVAAASSFTICDVIISLTDLDSFTRKEEFLLHIFLFVF